MTNLTPRTPDRPLLWPDIVLELADWLLDQDDATAVHVVGGAVRDAYLGYPLKDVDLVASEGAIKLGRRIADAFHGDVYVLDPEREVARVLLDTPDGKLNIDVAGYRAPDLLGDLTDRDFTLNAMSVDLRGDTSKLIDPLNGESDLKAKIIRRCSPNSLPHDPIRALRAVRQSIQLNARIEPETLRDIKMIAPELIHTSPERVRDEFFKLLSTSKPWAALRVAGQLGLLAPILPDYQALPVKIQTYTINTVEQLGRIFETISPARTDNTAAAFGLGALVVGTDLFRRKLQNHLNAQWPNERPHRALLFFAVVLRAIHAQQQTTVRGITEKYAESLRLSNPERARLEVLLSTAPNPVTANNQPLEVLTQHRYWHKLGEAGIDELLMALATYLATEGVNLQQEAWVTIIERARILLEAFYERHATVVAPDPLVDGHLLQKALKIKAGPIIGDLLDMLREQQVLGQIYNRDDAIDAARAYLNRLN